MSPRDSLYIEAVRIDSSTWTMEHIRAVIGVEAGALGWGFDDAVLLFGNGARDRDDLMGVAGHLVAAVEARNERENT